MELNDENLTVTVNKVTLAADWDHRTAIVGVQIGPITIDVSIWRNPRSGRLAVYLPSLQRGGGYYNAVEIPPDLRTMVEAEALAAYKDSAKADRAKQREAKRARSNAVETN